MNEASPKSAAHPAWLLAPSLIVGFAMLSGQHGWLAMLGFHGCMIAALVIHRRRLDWRRLLRLPRIPGLLANFTAAALLMALFSGVLFAYANLHGDYGAVLDRGLTTFAVPENSRLLFAIQLCLLNPLLEELFWRGLFFSDRKRPAATDFCYAAFHFFALIPFMPAPQAIIATTGLAGVGYSLRQMARRHNGALIIPMLWHALGDIAVVVAIARLTG